MIHFIIAFGKYPRPGHVKTRLAAEIGTEVATEIYEKLLATTLRNLPEISPAIQVWLAFDPPEAEAELAAWLDHRGLAGPHLKLRPQPTGNLGQRLHSLSAQAFQEGVASTVTLIGTDCPALQKQHFQAAWTALQEGADLVYGPATDGGFYLLAMKSPHPELFANIPWSTSETLASCQRSAHRIGLRTVLLEQLSDVDTLADWQRWQAGVSAPDPAWAQTS